MHLQNPVDTPPPHLDARGYSGNTNNRMTPVAIVFTVLGSVIAIVLLSWWCCGCCCGKVSGPLPARGKGGPATIPRAELAARRERGDDDGDGDGGERELPAAEGMAELSVEERQRGEGGQREVVGVKVPPPAYHVLYPDERESRGGGEEVVVGR
ncbi:hypothetical protein DM02DRAFT_732024 [Periconia macrospinosa]|uniref:Uncharacterized protein n=1 Tax=Periconia macrospinosa TaxID=97972 RepID=A0A2V1DAM1_9PLEO|nr:hypothetical protein DM02DRAFT_732024 [Periconia macrospinosa]